MATLTTAELVFQPRDAFVDLSDETMRRTLVSAEGTPAWAGRGGEIPFKGPPAIYLTTLGPPPVFAQNAGTVGAFALSGTVDPHDGPGCTPYYEAGGTAPATGWRLSVSDDSARTWSPLVKPRSVGAEGDYLRRLRWLKMGQSRERVLKLECTDPVRRNIIGIYIDADQGMS